MGSSRSFAPTANDNRPIKTWFPYGSDPEGLNPQPQTVTRRIIMQKARRHTLSLRTIVLRPLVGTWFQVHFPPLAGVLPIFPSLYFSTIGRQVVFSLTEWSP